MAHLLRLQTMGEMASEMAHELNQPLTAIVNYARGAGNRLRSHSASEAELAELMEKISAQALRAGELIRKMRAFAKRAEIEADECDINELVRNAVALLGAGGKINVPITFTLDRALPRVQVDGIQIEQVILNLARNGLEAIDGREGGGLLIRTERIGECGDRARGFGQRPGAGAGRRREALRPVLHDEARRSRSRPADQSEHRRGARRSTVGGERAGRGHDFPTRAAGVRRRRRS